MDMQEMMDAAASAARSPRALIIVGAPQAPPRVGGVRYCDAEIDLILVAEKFWLGLAKEMAKAYVKENDNARSTLPATLFGVEAEFYDAPRHDPIIAAAIRRSVSKN